MRNLDINKQSVKTNLPQQSYYELMKLNNEQTAFFNEGLNPDLAGSGKAGQGIIDGYTKTANESLKNIDGKVNSFKDGVTDEIDSELGAKFAGAGLDALGQTPNIINNFSSKSTNNKEATGKILSSAASGIKIGANFGPWGAAAGAVIGTGASLIADKGWKGKLQDNEDEISIENQNKATEERMKTYYNKNSSEQMKAQKNLMLKANGYSVTS